MLEDTDQMILLTPAMFLMGSAGDECGRLDVEGPQHRVTIRAAFEVGKFPVTKDQFALFVAESGYQTGNLCRVWDGGDWEERDGSFRNPGFAQDGNHPAVCVSWDDAQAYANWLAQRTKRGYRLLTEAEWEYAARAGTTSPYWWGGSITPDHANYNASTIYGARGQLGSWRQRTVSVATFVANPWGLFQMHGNIWEWVQDCWERDYNGAPVDGRARQETAKCHLRVLRGGSWANGPRGLRAARRHAARPDLRRSDIGFRLARTPSVA